MPILALDIWRLLFVLLGAWIVISGCGRDEPTPTWEPTPVALAHTLTPGPTNTPTWTPTSTSTPTPAATPTSTPTTMPTPTGAPAGPAALPRPTVSPEEVFIGDRSRRWLHIGFDVEGSPDILRETLDVLREFDYETTFWLQGEWVELHPDATRHIVAEGHEVANHSWTHRNFRELTADEVRWELEETEKLVLEVTGHSTKPYFRPPFGARNQTSREVAYDLGYTHIIWTFDARDWEPGATEDSVYHNIVDNATPGAIFYMHTSKPYGPPAVRRALQTLIIEEGWELVSLTEILTPPE